MRKTPPAVLDLIADLLEGSGVDQVRVTLFGGKVEQGAKTSKAMHEVQITDHPQVETGGCGEWKIGQNREDAAAPPWECGSIDGGIGPGNVLMPFGHALSNVVVCSISFIE
jgi:hypothetical protein